MLETGAKVGRYEIVDELGRGGMAVVYLARHVDLAKLVALKELVLGTADAQLAERFVREARTSGSLGHPNVVAVFDYFEHGGLPYIAMEYVAGGSLRPLVGRLTLAQIAGVLEGVLAGLAHAERHGIVHRDLKPENLLVTDEGLIKIADFGIAKAVDRTAVGNSLTAAGMTIGTPRYMAPEQARAERVGPAADLYSLGVIAYELFTGRVPFGEADTPFAALLMQHISEPVPDPLERNPDLDPELAAWTLRMLAKEPAQRPAGAAHAWDELEPAVLRLLDARWRRDAPLPVPTPRPSLPPAPFETPSPADGSDGYATYAPSEAVRGAEPPGSVGAAPPVEAGPVGAAPPAAAGSPGEAGSPAEVDSPAEPPRAADAPAPVAPQAEAGSPAEPPPAADAPAPVAPPPEPSPAAAAAAAAVAADRDAAHAAPPPDAPAAAAPAELVPTRAPSAQHEPPAAAPAPATPTAQPRPRRSPLTAILLAAAVALLGAATALGLGDGAGAGSAKPAASATATATPTATPTATAAALTERQVVDRVAAILDFSAIGHQERVAGHFNAALTNRRESLRRVQALERQTNTLAKDLGLLETAARASLKAVQAYIACGGAKCAPNETQAALHAKLAFAASFNPLARRYLQRSYTPSDF